MFSKVENRTTKTFDKGVSHSIYKALVCIDSMTISLIPLEDQMIQINVSILYANTTGFIVIVEEKTCKHPIFRGNGQSEGFFAMVMNCCGYI